MLTEVASFSHFPNDLIATKAVRPPKGMLGLSALSSLDFWVGGSLRCQAVVSHSHGIHHLATVATPGRVNHSEP